MLALLVELILKLRNPVVCPPESTQTLRSHLDNGDFIAAWQHSSENPSVLCTVMQRALRKLPRGQDAVETESAEALMDVNNIYRTKISYLGVVAGVAPMLGLLGTVSGMIKAFDKMGHEGAIGDPAKLAGDIGEALVTTFSGLLVAIPAMIVFYVMTNRLKKILTYVQEQFTGLMEDLDYNEVPDDLVLGNPEQATAGTPVASAAPRAKPKAAPSETVPCPSCNRQVTIGSNTCGGCGQELDWD
jgi:biopolymer transport protein ExbB